MNQLILVLDFGGQYKELIAGTVRKSNVYSEIHSGNMKISDIVKLNPIGIILTGGPNSVYLPDAQSIDPEIFDLGIPILGICYGMQLMCHSLGGEVAPGKSGEYGCVTVTPETGKKYTALMSHRDIVRKVPDGFKVTAKTALCIAACENAAKKLYGLQFHPESKHTKGGRKILKDFLFNICGAKGDYKLSNYLDKQINEIRLKTAGNKVLLALSGGVDSAVLAALLSDAIPDKLTCIFVDHGFMRLNEGDEIERVFSKRDLNFVRVNAEERFLAKIKGISDPETKRKIVGEEFIRVFEEEAEKIADVAFLAQGTIYPDVVESGGEHGATIKSHHNVGGLPDNLSFKGIIEPLAGLFKDEVRSLGKKLGLPEYLVNRQPFPGPGLAIRIMGEVTLDKLNTLRQADAVLRQEIDELKTKPNQYFAVLTNTHSVGVKGDERTYDYVIAIRAVTTDDFMTCEYTPLSHKVLSRISARITNEIKGVSRVVYDITSKPPATIEWE